MGEALHSALTTIGIIIAGSLQYLNVTIADPVKGLLLIPLVYLMLRAALKFRNAYGSGQIIVLSTGVLYVALTWLLPPKVDAYIGTLVSVYISAVLTYLLYGVYLSVKEPLHCFVQRLRQR